MRAGCATKSNNVLNQFLFGKIFELAIFGETLVCANALPSIFTRSYFVRHFSFPSWKFISSVKFEDFGEIYKNKIALLQQNENILD